MKYLKYNQLSNNHVRYLQKKTNCVVYTRSEFIIMIHSMPHVVIPLNRCFLRKHLSSWRHNVASQEDGGLRVQRRSMSFQRYLCTIRLFQITREGGDLWHCASVLVWVFRVRAHPRRPQLQTGSGVHLGKSNRIYFAVSYNFCNNVFRSQ